MTSEGDPRVHFVINLALSGAFAYVLVWGYDFVGGAPFSWRSVGVLTLLLMALTYLVTR